jgi:biotin synthase
VYPPAPMNPPPRSARHDWTREEVASFWRRPLLDLVFEAQVVHRVHHDPVEVQWATLLSIKTGGCPEDCAYCPQAARYATGVRREALLPLEEVERAAAAAKAAGAGRFCMGGAYRDVPDGPAFERILEMVRAVKRLGLEACLTLGMLREDQARRLAEAGLDAYNHNLDTGEGFHSDIITTRTYRDRLDTLKRVSDAGIRVCCGGILGMGESDDDRIDLLHTLSNLDPHPESVPINILVRVPGTPLEHRPPLDPLDVVRTVAVARILVPRARIRLSAGRRDLSDSDHALCFLAGANSIFSGERLLTTPNVRGDRDEDLLHRLGMRKSSEPHPPTAEPREGRAASANAPSS